VLARLGEAGCGSRHLGALSGAQRHYIVIRDLEEGIWGIWYDELDSGRL
jgi:hypothetical protein